MAKKRLKKKKAKQAQISTLKSRGYTEKEIKSLYPREVKAKATRIQASDKARINKENRINKLADFGIPIDIINRDKLYLKKYEELTPKQLGEIKRQAQKEKALIDLGVSYNKSDLKLGWDKLNAKYNGITLPEGHKTRGTTGTKKQAPLNPNIRFSVSDYLYVGFADVMGEGFDPTLYQDFGINELYDMARDRMKEAATFVDGSASFSGVFHFEYGSKSDMEYIARAYYKRGYNMTPKHVKLDQKRYSKITVSNSWTQEEFMRMYVTCINQMRNDDVDHFYNVLKRYCSENNLPFMKKL